MAGEWFQTTLGELITEQGGSVKTGPFGTTLKASEYSTEGVPLISVREVGYGTLRLDEATPYVPRTVTDRLPEYILRTGDIVFGRKGAVDRSAHINEEQDGWFLGSDGIRLRLPETCDSRFVAYQVQTPSTRSWLIQHATGTTMPSLNQKVIQRIPIVLPPIKEQRAIAHILGTLDDKIELNRRMNETLEEMARAIFKSWFVDFDPVRAKAEGRDPGLPKHVADLFPDSFEDSELGEVPAGWSLTSLNEVLAANNDRVGEGSVPEYSSTNEGLQLRSERFKKQLSASISNNKLIRQGDLVFGLSRRVLNFGLMREEVGCVSPAYKVYAIDTNMVVPDFLERVMRLRSTYFYGAISASSREGQSVSAEGLGLLKFVRPHSKAQEVFYSATEPIRDRAETLRSETLTLTAVRDTLLPELVSGELRVPDAKRFVDEAMP